MLAENKTIDIRPPHSTAANKARLDIQHTPRDHIMVIIMPFWTAHGFSYADAKLVDWLAREHFGHRATNE